MKKRWFASIWAFASRQFYIIKIKTKSARQNFAMSAPIYMSLCKRTTSSRITSLELVTPKRQGLAYLMTMSNIIINAHTFWNFICTYLLYASLFNIEKCMNKKVSAFYLHQILIIVISLDLKIWVFYWYFASFLLIWNSHQQWLLYYIFKSLNQIWAILNCKNTSAMHH